MTAAVRFRSAVSLLGRFPALAGVDLDVARRRGGAGPGRRTARARPRCCVPAPAWSASRPARPRCWATTCAATAGPSAAGSACWATPPPLRRPHRRRQPALRGPGGGRRRRGRRTRRMARLGLDGRLRDVPVGQLSAGQRRRVAVAAVRRPPARAVAARRAPRRPRRRRPRPARRAGAGGGGRRRHRAARLPRARPGRGPSPRRPWSMAGGQVARRRDTAAEPGRAGSRSMWRDAALVAGKDLRVEARSRVATNQVVPFALLVLVVFAFALDSRPGGRSPGGPRPVLGGGPVLGPPRHPAVASRSRPPTTPATPCACPGSTAPASSSARPRPSRVAAGRARGRARRRRRRALRRRRCGGAVLLAADLRRWPPSGWPPRARSTASSPPACGCATRCCPCSSCRCSRPSCSPPPGRARPRSPATPADGWPWVQLLAVFAAVYVAFGIVAFGPLLEEA